MHRHPTGEAPNYTNAFLVSFGVVVFVALFAIWAVWGMLVAGAISWLADRAMIKRLRRG